MVLHLFECEPYNQKKERSSRGKRGKDPLTSINIFKKTKSRQTLILSPQRGPHELEFDGDRPVKADGIRTSV